MPTHVELVLGESGRAAIQSLHALVYPPETMKLWLGRDVTWAPATKRVLVRADDGTVVCHAGVHVRDAEWDGLPVRIGGIGELMTHPDHRRQGHARAVLTRALAALRDEAKVAYALLFCEPELVMFYVNLGWRRFTGEVIVQQPGGPAPFAKFLAMTLGVRQPAATLGRLDLRGLPW